ncbi:hypothetical protein PROFUN_06819 [Planoprotostelium fungivorum]|uniref:Uncharacterized protein n=1 Tax=Planoprotostelium fungivorum TaxID=1890364 RepID=A0A2P6NNB0_9EUKA|nr:hypothetical protein PROFUN_06819 [Planoprotostelium fungivorum]
MRMNVGCRQQGPSTTIRTCCPQYPSQSGTGKLVVERRIYPDDEFETKLTRYSSGPLCRQESGSSVTQLRGKTHGQEQMVDQAYWNNYYASGEAPTEGSTFARSALDKVAPNSLLFELGCGNGRDSIFFAQHGIRVVGCDISVESIRQLKDKWASAGNLLFYQGDFTNLPIPPPREAIDRFHPEEEVKGPIFDVMYSRFTLHAIRKEDASRTILWSSKNVKEGGLFLIEVRSVLDPMCGKGTKVEGEEDAWINTHYRRFIRREQLKEELIQVGFTIEDEVESAGLSVWRDDDPVLIRITARKKAHPAIPKSVQVLASSHCLKLCKLCRSLSAQFGKRSLPSCGPFNGEAESLEPKPLSKTPCFHGCRSETLQNRPKTAHALNFHISHPSWMDQLLELPDF